MAWTIRAGAVLATGEVLTEAVVSAKVASLAEGVLKMFLLSKLRIVAGGFLLLAAVLVAGWTCAPSVSAQADVPGDDVAPRTEESTGLPARTMRATKRPTESREAEFVFRGTSRAGKTVSLVIAGTSAPVLSLPVKQNLRVLLGGRQVGIDGLPTGTRVAIRLDATNTVIQEIRALQLPDKVTVLKRARALTHLESPPTEEVLRALPKVPGSAPGIFEVYRDDIQVVAERLVRQVDPPRFFPLLGEAELHHCHWKCTVYYQETVESSYPCPFRTKRPRVEVVYIDKDYLVPTR
jgi:hypothetical protein